MEWRAITPYGVQALGLLAAAAMFSWLLISAGGAAFWATLCGVLVSIIWAFDRLLRAIQQLRGMKPAARSTKELTLAAVSVSLTLMGTEGVLAWHESSTLKSGPPDRALEKRAEDQISVPKTENSQLSTTLSAFSISMPPEVFAQALRRHSLITMPHEWERRPATVEGAARASFWHGVLHVYDSNSIRRTSEFPMKRSDVFRILVVGDSLTYGDGIEERFTYPAVLQRLMDDRYSIEVLNLGSEGFQSEDVKRRVYEFVPRLRPNLIIYGVCHNDFLPSGVGQYSVNDAFAIPIPEHFKQDLAKRSRIIKLSGEGYNSLLLRLGLRADFYDDILKDFRNYQGRFARDAEAINSYVISQGLPPVVAIVLDQFPAVDSRGHRITKLAERYLRQAGVSVIDSEQYNRRFTGQNLTVSRWEGHPNEVANAIWAKMIETHLRSRSELKPFEKRRHSQ